MGEIEFNVTRARLADGDQEVREILMARGHQDATEFHHRAGGLWGVTVLPENVRMGRLRSAGESGTYAPVPDGESETGTFESTWAIVGE
jgi:hypothetical protein